MARYPLIFLLLLIPMTASAQVKLGPFTFLKDSKASVLTANFVLGSAGFAGASAELPPLKALSFFDFIPGYANKLFVTSDGSSVYAELAFITRARYRPKRKIIGLLGLGPVLAVSKGKFKPDVSILLGINYLISQKYVLTLDFRSTEMLTIGLGWHNGFGWR